MRATLKTLDAETNGLYDFRARIYSPTLGRFMQVDTIGAKGGVNLYAYVGNDPLNLIDPFGLMPSLPANALAGDTSAGAPISGLQALGVVATAEAFIMGGSALFGGGAATAVATAETTVTIANVAAALPEGMSPAAFGQLAGFSQGLAASSQASTVASAEVIANLQSAGVTPQAISLAQQFYAGVANANPANLPAVQRAALLANILKGYQ